MIRVILSDLKSCPDDSKALAVIKCADISQNNIMTLWKCRALVVTPGPKLLSNFSATVENAGKCLWFLAISGASRKNASLFKQPSIVQSNWQVDEQGFMYWHLWCPHFRDGGIILACYMILDWVRSLRWLIEKGSSSGCQGNQRPLTTGTNRCTNKVGFGGGGGWGLDSSEIANFDPKILTGKGSVRLYSLLFFSGAMGEASRKE